MFCSHSSSQAASRGCPAGSAILSTVAVPVEVSLEATDLISFCLLRNWSPILHFVSFNNHALKEPFLASYSNVLMLLHTERTVSWTTSCASASVNPALTEV